MMPAYPIGLSNTKITQIVKLSCHYNFLYPPTLTEEEISERLDLVYKNRKEIRKKGPHLVEGVYLKVGFDKSVEFCQNKDTIDTHLIIEQDTQEAITAAIINDAISKQKGTNV